MRGCYCTEFTKTFKGINIELGKSDNKGFDYSLLLIYLNELDKGFKVKRINKTTKKGTTVIYESIKDSAELEEYRKLLYVKLGDFNNKWDENLTLS